MKNKKQWPAFQNYAVSERNRKETVNRAQGHYESERFNSRTQSRTNDQGRAICPCLKPTKGAHTFCRMILSRARIIPCFDVIHNLSSTKPVRQHHSGLCDGLHANWAWGFETRIDVKSYATSSGRSGRTQTTYKTSTTAKFVQRK